MHANKNVQAACCFLAMFSVFHIAEGGFDDLDNFINPEDLEIFSDIFSTTPSSISPAIGAELLDDRIHQMESEYNISDSSDCFGMGGITSKLRWVFNMKPKLSREIEVEFFVSTRKLPTRAQVMIGEQFGLEWTFFEPKKPTIIIVHGFLSYGNASWVVNMTKAFLEWDDVNVIAVDWSKGGNTWKYWRAVANTRTVGADLARFLKQLMDTTGAKTKDFHFVGHSLGAHICSFAAAALGGVRRITGLDPAQPCFVTEDLNMLLDKSDAQFVDVIHTNGRVLSKLGLGMPNASGHQDFYPNGGMKQPGCHTGKSSFFNKILPISKSKVARAVCNHGRAYSLFTESLKNHSCSLMGHQWNLTYKGVNASINTPCNRHNCAELGVRADKYDARGSFYVVTTSRKPYCANTTVKVEVRAFLLSDLKKAMNKTITTTRMTHDLSSTTAKPSVKKSGWFWFG